MTYGLTLVGAHRGGRALVNAITPQALQPYGVIVRVADPKPGRAESLGREIERRFARQAEPLAISGLEALRSASDAESVAVAVDTLDSTTEMIHARSREQTMHFGILGIIPTNIEFRTGFQGTLQPGNAVGTAASALLLETLSAMSRESGASQLAEDQLGANVLASQRELVALRTAEHLNAHDRDPWDLPGTWMSMVMGGQLIPVMPIEGDADDRHAHRKERALEVVSHMPDRVLQDGGAYGRRATVAVVVRAPEKAIHFYTVARRRHRMSLDTAFEFKLPRPEQMIATRPAIFTD